MGIAIVLALVGAWAAAAPGAEDRARELAEARRLLEAGAFGEAAEAFAKLLASGMEGVEVRVGLAEARELTGRYEEALEALEGDAPALVRRRGDILAGIGRHEEAEKAYRSALAARPADVHALVALGRLLMEAGRREEGEALFRKALDVYQALPVEAARRLPAATFVDFGLALIGLNRFREANDIMFWQAQKIERDSLPYLFALGDALLAKYNYPDARSCFRDALHRRPRHPRALCGLAEAMLVDFQLGSGRFAKVERRIAQALEVNPRHAKAHELRGDVALYDGDLERAAACFREALATNPKALQVRGKLAACALLAGDREAFARERALAARASRRPAPFFAAAAEAVNQHYRYPLAVELAEEAHRIDPAYWPVYVTLGMAYLRACRYEEGERFIERAFQSDRFNVWAYNTRKLIRHMKADFVEERRPGFVFHLPREDAPFLLPYLAPLLAAVRERLAARYAFQPPEVHIEAFSEHQWFSARTTGLPGMSAAGACFGRLVTLTTPKALPEHWGVVACHEFAHVVTVLKTAYRIPRWLTEGISVREEGLSHPGWEREFDQAFVDGVGHGRLPRVETFDRSFRKPTRPGEVLSAYYMAGIVVEFIEGTFGIERLRALLDAYRTKTTDEAFRGALGLAPKEFDARFARYARERARATGLEARIEPGDLPALEDRVAADPRDAAAHARLAWGAYFTGGAVDVPIHAGRALEIDPECADAHAALGMQAARARETDEAIASLRKAVAGGCAYRFLVRAALGRLLAAKGERDGAIALLEEARRIAPRASATGGGGSVLKRLASLYDEAGEAEKALACLRAQAAVDHRDMGTRRELARRLRLREAWADAAAVLEEIVLANPFGREAHEELAFVLEKAGRPRDAIRENEVLLAYPDAPKDALRAEIERLRARIGGGAGR